MAEITDSTTDSTLTYEANWIGEKATYELATTDSTIDTTNQVIASYIEEIETQPIGQFRKVEEDISTAFSDKINFTTDAAKIEDAKDRNEDIDNSRLIDYYKRIALQIYLSTLAIEIYDFNGDQENWIRFIAPLCPFEAGPAVYTMRTMYNYLDDHTEFYDDDCDENVSFRKGASSIGSTPSPDQFFVYPNPAKDELNIEYFINEESNSLLEISDLTGRIVSSRMLPSSEHHVVLQTTNIKPGTYFYTIYNNNNRIMSEKLIIIK